MKEWQARTQMLLGDGGLAALEAARVVVVGVGGVGAAAAEMVVRSGVGHIVLIDPDTVSPTNINRQLPALHSTVGLPKAEVLKTRLLDINPGLDVATVQEFLSEDNIQNIFSVVFPSEKCAPLGTIIYVIDAIDTLSPKIALAQFCLAQGLPLVSSMGSGGKYDATQVRVADISKTYECPLARMMRKRLHKLGIEKGFKAVFSPEIPDKERMTIEETRNKKSQVGTISYMPAVFGCVCAQTVICDIVGKR